MQVDLYNSCKTVVVVFLGAKLLVCFSSTPDFSEKGCSALRRLFMPVPAIAFCALTLLVGRQEGHPACKRWGADVVICLERGADLHMAQLMPLPLPLTVSCFSKIQICFTFLVPAHLGSPGKRATKRVCVCVPVTETMFQCIVSENGRRLLHVAEPSDRCPHRIGTLHIGRPARSHLWGLGKGLERGRSSWPQQLPISTCQDVFNTRAVWVPATPCRRGLSIYIIVKPD